MSNKVAFNVEGLRECKNDDCGSLYSPHKSNSSLRLTFCTIFCEIKALGFSIEALERNEPLIFKSNELPSVELAV